MFLLHVLIIFMCVLFWVSAGIYIIVFAPVQLYYFLCQPRFPKLSFTLIYTEIRILLGLSAYFKRVALPGSAMPLYKQHRFPI